jgi:cell pole-organizing protein PopZ
MSQPAKAQEPTMEEILASIRRIIADDDAAKPPAEPVKPSAPAPPRPVQAPAAQSAPASAFDDAEKDAAGSDVFELTEAMQSDAAAFGTIDGPPDVMFNDAPEPEEAPPPPARAAPPMAAPPPDRSLLSPHTAAAVDLAFNSLAHTVLVQNSRTLEDLVREMLKPMLKAWLDPSTTRYSLFAIRYSPFAAARRSDALGLRSAHDCAPGEKPCKPCAH